MSDLSDCVRLVRSTAASTIELVDSAEAKTPETQQLLDRLRERATTLVTLADGVLGRTLDEEIGDATC